jgi:hypothetical protein
MFGKGFIRVLIFVIALALGFCFSTEGFGQPRNRNSAGEEEKRKEDREKPAVRPQPRKEEPPQRPAVGPQPRREQPPPQRPAVRPQPRREQLPSQRPAVRRQPRREQPPVVRPSHRHHFPSYGTTHDRIPEHNRILWRDREYFYHRDRGVFYHRRGSVFVIVRPPFGIVVPLPPPGFVRFLLGGIPYYYYGDVFYRRVPSGYVVVEPPHVLVKTYILNVRSGPGMQHPVINEVYEGEVLLIHGNAPGWLYVQLPDESYGWVSQAFTEPAPPVPSG